MRWEKRVRLESGPSDYWPREQIGPTAMQWPSLHETIYTGKVTGEK